MQQPIRLGVAFHWHAAHDTVRLDLEVFDSEAVVERTAAGRQEILDIGHEPDNIQT